MKMGDQLKQFKFSTYLPQIIERSADGWWTGKIDGKVGVIPASFVEEIAVPQSKEEAKKLVKRFKQGKLSVETHTESRPESLASELNCTMPVYLILQFVQDRYEQSMNTCSVSHLVHTCSCYPMACVLN